MGKGDILIHAPTPLAPGSHTGRLSLQHKFQGQTSPSPLPGPVQAASLGLSSQRLTLQLVAHPRACCVPMEWLFAGVNLVNSERQAEKFHLKGLGLEDTLNLEMIFRRAQVS